MMQLDLSAKRVLVVEGTAGLGRRIVEEFHALDATVAVHGTSARLVTQTIQALGGAARLVAAPGALGSARDVVAWVGTAIEAMSGLDVLVNAASTLEQRRVEEVTESFWQECVDRDLKSAFFAAQACVPALRRSRGCVVNLISVFANVGGPPGTAVFSAVQGGLVQLTRMMALEMGRDGIRVNALCHGLHEYVARESPLGRAGSADDCVGAVLHLASSHAAYTTGALLTVDGGLSSGF